MDGHPHMKLMKTPCFVNLVVFSALPILIASLATGDPTKTKSQDLSCVSRERESEHQISTDSCTRR